MIPLTSPRFILDFVPLAESGVELLETFPSGRCDTLDVLLVSVPCGLCIGVILPAGNAVKGVGVALPLGSAVNGVGVALPVAAVDRGVGVALALTIRLPLFGVPPTREVTIVVVVVVGPCTTETFCPLTALGLFVRPAG